MKQVFLLGGLALTALAAYLVAWPVPIEPAVWDAPKDEGYVGDFAHNTKLANLDILSIGDTYGPEDVDSRRINGQLFVFAPTHEGLILKINPKNGDMETIADTGGVPLGCEFDKAGNLIVADAYKGLLSVSLDGTVSVLTNEVNGTPILYADDLDIGPDGVIYFSDASTKFGAEWAKGTMQGSLYEIMEHGRTGRVLAYDPASQKTWTVMDNLSFANGVAMAVDGQSILVNETGEYRIHRIWVDGPKKGTSEIVIDNLPGFPDNINRAPGGNYYVGLVSKRAAFLDDYSDSPFWRKLAWRLPQALQPQAEDYGFVIEMDDRGNILQTWQDPTGAYPATTGAHAASDGYLYITSLTADRLARLKLPEKSELEKITDLAIESCGGKDKVLSVSEIPEFKGFKCKD